MATNAVGFGLLGVLGTIAFVGCSLLTSNALDDKEATPTGGSGGEGGMTSGLSCETHEDCPGINTTCRFRVCELNECGFDTLPEGSGCSEDGGKLCSANGACVECLSEAECASGELCLQNQCAPAHCGDGVENEGESDVDCGGTCPPCDLGKSCSMASDCITNFCNGSVCSACTTKAECEAGVADTYCAANGFCVDEKVNGDACADDVECLSGICADADQTCCQSECAGCDSCLSGATGQPSGQCFPVMIGADPHDTCALSPPESCGTLEHCNGSGDCQYHPVSTVCSTASCMAGTQTFDGSCSGNGMCNADPDVSCGAFECMGVACRTTCAEDTHCVGTNICVGADCVACGTSTPPAGVNCPDGPMQPCDMCSGNTCIINCPASGPKCDVVACPAGWDCEVNCAVDGACANSVINCPSSESCVVDCTSPSTGTSTCDGTTINCGDGTCDLECSGGQTCANVTLNCGKNACTANCDTGEMVTFRDNASSCMAMNGCN